MKRQQFLKNRSSSNFSIGRKFFLAVAFLMISANFVLAQKNLTGIVSGMNKATIPGVSVIIKGTSIGTSTDINGKYSLSVPKDAKIIVFTAIGMESLEVPIGEGTVLNVTLSESLVEIDEVVVVGYGEQSRSKLTTSISKLDTKVLENAAISNVGSALQGTIPGLRVIGSNGQPGTVPTIILRGGASITSQGSPLVVVDGVVRAMNDINSADIESIQVLKDAASTAIYGARANNGVILIKTKKGQSGKSEVMYTLKAGVNILRESYNYVNAHDYIYYNRLGMNATNLSRAQGGVAPINPDNQQGYGFVNPHMFDIAKITSANRSNFSSLLSEGWQWMIDPINNRDTIVYKDYLGQIGDAAFNTDAYVQDHNISFTGGNDKGKFAAILGYYSEDGLVIGTKYERFSGTFSGSYKIKDNLEISSNTTYSNSKRPAFLPGDIFFRSQAMFPTLRPNDLNGDYASGSSSLYGNPLYYVDKNIRLNETRRSIFNVGADWDIIPNLQMKIQANLYYTDNQEDNFNKKIVYQTGNIDINRTASANYAKTFQQQHNITLEYKKSIQSHNMTLLVGGEYFDLSSYTLSAAGKSAPTDDIYTLNSAVERTSISSILTDYRMISGFSRFNYDFKGRYLLSAVFRVDGTSVLEDYRWGSFPGISAGWNMHQENFYKASKIKNIISTLKPRASYGVNGNIAGVGNYETQGAYGTQTLYNAQAAYLNTGLVNPGLRWEKSKSFDGGVELGLFNNRATMVLNYFRRTTTDLLTNLVLPEYTGFSTYRTNNGNLLNTGFESEININILKLKNGLTWDFGFNASYVKNKILKLPYNGNPNNRQGGEEVYDPKTGKLIWVAGYQEGGAIGDLVAFKQERIYKDWDDVNMNAAFRYDKIANLYGPALYRLQTSKTGKFPIEPGDVVFTDFDRNDTIDSRDRYVIGNIYPKWTGGFSTSISYKGFSLYGRFDFALGHMIYNDLACRTLGQWVGYMNLTDWIYDTWTPENPEADLAKFYYADYPKYNYKRTGWLGTTGSNMVSRFYEKGDYLALRELTFSFQFPKSVTSKLKMSALQAYVTGQNLAYFTKEYTGASPELGGFDPGRYPLPITYIFGLQVSF